MVLSTRIIFVGRDSIQLPGSKNSSLTDGENPQTKFSQPADGRTDTEGECCRLRQPQPAVHRAPQQIRRALTSICSRRTSSGSVLALGSTPLSFLRSLIALLSLGANRLSSSNRPSENEESVSHPQINTDTCREDAHYFSFATEDELTPN